VNETAPEDNPAALIAMDLATVILQGGMLSRPGERIPPVTKLMSAYAVANATVVSALRRLRELGLTRTVAGSGTFVGELPYGLRPEEDGEYPARSLTGDVVLLFLASQRCTHEAAIMRAPWETDAPTIDIYAYDRQEEQDFLVRKLDASALAAWDRKALRALGDAFLAAGRRIVGYGPGEVERHLLAVAKSIMDTAAVRPEKQPGIAISPGYADEVSGQAYRRIWPERFTKGGPDDPPF
jgi:DNA-binding transcriptional MocR family regulator